MSDYHDFWIPHYRLIRTIHLRKNGMEMSIETYNIIGTREIAGVYAFRNRRNVRISCCDPYTVKMLHTQWMQRKSAQ
jgi:hypothetical protein